MCQSFLSEKWRELMQNIRAIGEPPWSREDLRNKLREFAELYKQRPIENNEGGMRSPHMYLVWFALQKLKPKAVVESGVLLGLGTWFFEKACPDAKLYCIDLNLGSIRYRSSKAEYFDRDFSTIDWNHLPKDETVLFFDDHQNAFERVKTAKWFGFKHLIFEDNYPALQGDCYSLKKAFMHAGFQFTPLPPRNLWAKLSLWRRTMLGVPTATSGGIPPNAVDAEYLKNNLEIYHEFPPIFQGEFTRWGDPWDQDNYPTPEPLLQSVEEDYHQTFKDEAAYYTWMCYVKLK
jgi:hypothetical protein